MTYPVTVYRWDDPGAPQLPNNGNSGPTSAFKEILLKCLVQGYGTKQPAGWSVVFDDTNGFVLQNNVAAGGSGGMVRLWPGPSRGWDSALYPNANSCAFLQPAKAYSASDAPFKPGYPIMLASPRFPGSSDSEKRAWVIIATAIGFFMDLQPYQSGNTTGMYSMLSNQGYNFYCGDIISVIPGDDYKFTAFARGWTGAVNSIINSGVSMYDYSLQESTGNLTSSIGPGFIMYAANGDASSINYHAAKLMRNVSSGNGYTQTGQYDLLSLNYVWVANSSVAESSPSNDIQSNILPKVRGYVPGLFTSMIGDGGGFTGWPYVRSIDGQNHWLLKIGNGMSVTWINMVEW